MSTESEPVRSLPELMRLADGTPVETAAQWEQRRRELLALFEEYMYGKMPDAAQEEVSWQISAGEEAQVRNLKITVRRKGREASYTVRVTLPEKPAAGMACFLEYCPFSWFGKPMISPNSKIAAARGYAAIQYDPVSVASDNDRHEGAYFDLYPYGEEDRQLDL